MVYLRYFLVGTAFGLLLFLLMIVLVTVTAYDPKYDLSLFFGVGFLGGVLANAAVSITDEIRKSK